MRAGVGPLAVGVGREHRVERLRRIVAVDAGLGGGRPARPVPADRRAIPEGAGGDAPPVAAAADVAPWDQARATALARELADACDSFEQAVRKQPGIDALGEGSAEPGLSLTGRAQALAKQSRALADHLAAGNLAPYYDAKAAAP
jgi:hypothetical protein